MTIRKKLQAIKELEARNEARRKAYLDTVGAHKALEIHATALIGSLDILAQHYRVSRTELLDQLIVMLQAANSQYEAKKAAIFFGESETEG